MWKIVEKKSRKNGEYERKSWKKTSKNGKKMQDN